MDFVCVKGCSLQMKRFLDFRNGTGFSLLYFIIFPSRPRQSPRGLDIRRTPAVERFQQELLA
jgi:hypothetical protein